MVTFRTYLFFSMIGLFFIDSFLPTNKGVVILGVLTFIVTVLFLPSTKGLPKIFGSLMLVIGTAVVIYQGKPFSEWAISFTSNLPLAALITLAPILTIPITLGGYDVSIGRIAHKYRSKPSILYLVITMVFNFLSPIINLGSVTLIDSMLKKLELPREYRSKVYVRAFTSVIPWSPYFAAMMLVITYVDISVTEYLPYGLLLGLSQIIIGALLYILIESKNIELPSLNTVSTSKDYKVLELIIAFTLMTGIIFYLESLLKMKMIIIVTLIILIYPLVWSIYLRSVDKFVFHLNKFRTEKIPKSANEIVLFITAGFFGFILSGTIIGELINRGLTIIADYSVLLTIFLTIFITILLGFLGVHHIVTLTSIANSIQPIDLGMSNVAFSLILMSSWAIVTFTSPITPANAVFSNMFKMSYFKLLFKQNGIYAILTLIAHTTIIYIVHLFTM